MDISKEKKKSIPVSVRLDAATQEKLEEIINMLEETTDTQHSFSDVWKRMINLYYRYLQNLDKEAIQEVQRQGLLKALTEGFKEDKEA
jgi:hypothetical protein